MDNFDKRIKQIAKDENWEIPNEIDNNISKLLKNIEEPKTVRKRPLKVAILVASLSILTITTAFAIENIIEYFNYNKNSEYISSKEELETFGSVVSLTSKDKGIEFKLDNISVDDNYINISLVYILRLKLFFILYLDTFILCIPFSSFSDVYTASYSCITKFLSFILSTSKFINGLAYLASLCFSPVE